MSYLTYHIRVGSQYSYEPALLENRQAQYPVTLDTHSVIGLLGKSHSG